jgi:ABC-2 type transport system ATP-binding protein
VNAIEVTGLHRGYAVRGSPEVLALRGIDLTVGAGQVHALLGPNGAGKTTLCKILSTVLLPTSGTATVLGHDVVRDADRVKHSVGIVFGGDRGLYGRLTARQNLRFWAALYGLRAKALRTRVDLLLQRVGLTERAEDRVENFSRGMKQRLHLARGMVADPPVLILDEPTLGMDPVAAQDFRALVGQLRAEGRTLLLTTHDMAEAAALCDRVTLIDGGRVLMSQAPAQVGALISRYERVDVGAAPQPVFDAIGLISGVVSVARRPDGTTRVETATAGATREVLAILVAQGVTDLSTGTPSLEEVYLHLVGKRGMEVAR